MDFLNQISKQLSELFRSMTPGSRIAIGLLLAILSVSLFFLFSGKITESGEYLFAGESFGTTQIQKMEAAFGVEGLSGSTSIPTGDGFKVKVEGNKASYIAALVKHKSLPPNCYDAVQEALNEVGPFTSPTQVNQFIHNGKTIKLTQMIAALDSVEKAELMFTKKKSRGFNNKEKSSATVMVKPIPGEIISASLANSIQRMAASSLCIPAADITVADGKTGHCFSGDLNTGEIADRLADSERETNWQQRIRNLIGIEGMTVVVNVERDPYKSHKEFVISPDKKGTVAKKSYEKSGSSKSQLSATTGRPGPVSNAANRIAVTATPANNNSTQDSETMSDNLVAGSTKEIVYDTNREQQVNVSIQLPSEHFAKIWQSKNQTAEGEEPKTPTAAELATIEAEVVARTKQLVTNLLKRKGVKDPSEFVYVTSYQSFTFEPTEAPGMTSKATAWFGKYWTVLGLFGLAFFSLRALRSVMRSVPVEISDSTTQERQKSKLGKIGNQDDTVSEETAKAVAFQMLKKFDGTGPSLRDELTVLVNQDTDAAATILRGWIGNPIAKT